MFAILTGVFLIKGEYHGPFKENAVIPANAGTQRL